eukprot:708318-Alexandrium_andersonii.AAC.1
MAPPPKQKGPQSLDAWLAAASGASPSTSALPSEARSDGREGRRAGDGCERGEPRERIRDPPALSFKSHSLLAALGC